MRLSAKPIVTFGNINNYVFGNQWTIRAGDPNTLYFQILDIDQAVSGNGQGSGVFSGISAVGTTAGLRYLLGIGAPNQPYGVEVTFMSIDSSKKIVATAVQADANDSSIWKVSILSTQIPGGGNVQFAVQEGTSIRRFSVTGMLGVEFPTNEGSC
jgi:hypothetical protein